MKSPRSASLGAMLAAFVLATCTAIGAIAASSAASQNAAAQNSATSTTSGPPAARTDNVTDDYFGTKVTDPYRWLEDQNSPETRAWIDKENAYTNSVLAKIPGRDALHARLSELFKVDSTGMPIARGGKYFYSKRDAAEDQAKLYVCDGLNGKEEVLVDPLPLSADHTASVNLDAVSNDGTMIVYAVRQGGADESTPHVMEVASRRELPDKLPLARYQGMDFTTARDGVYYAYQTKSGPRVFWHKFGTDVASDPVVFGKDLGPEKIVGSNVTDDGRYLLLYILYGASADRTDVYFKDLRANGPIIPIVNNTPSRFMGDEAGGMFYFLTNWNAPNNRIIAIDPTRPDKTNWKTIVTESDAPIQSMSLIGGQICALYTINAHSQIKLYDTEGHIVREVSLPTIGSASGLSGRWNSSEAFYSFNSFYVPPTIYRYDLQAGTQTVWARRNVPVDSSKFTMQQFWYNSKDGARVPMFIAHLNGLKLDGKNPTLMTAYGGFDLDMEPTFSAMAVAWMEQGGVYALPNLRGGGEFGEDWHRAGMLEKKQNVFNDFFAAAEWLIAHKYTNPSKLAIEGSSNGGLLMGAAITQRPDLFAAVMCGFPLLDMLRYQNFLVARYWVPEYGSSEDPKQFPFIYAYSPYQHVKQGEKYPAVLFVTGDADTRVAPLHARKMAALMQADAAPGKPILLKYDTKAGHAGGAPIGKQVDDTTDELSFLFWQLGVTPKPIN
jgi:prolyl oligopeptidase